MIVIGCIACGGYLEIALIIVGLRFVCKWLKERHDKKHCKCCKDKDEHRSQENKASE